MESCKILKGCNVKRAGHALSIGAEGWPLVGTEGRKAFEEAFDVSYQLSLAKRYCGDEYYQHHG